MKISKIFPLFLVCACAVGFASTLEARTPPPKREASTSPSVAPNPNPRLSPTESNPKPAFGTIDLTIDSAKQTSPDFWVVRIKNLGKIDAGATTLQATINIPKSGTFPPGSMGPYSFPTSPVKGGGVTDVNVKTSMKTKPGMRLEFTVNPKKTVKESDYSNNSTGVLANPAYK